MSTQVTQRRTRPHRADNGCARNSGTGYIDRMRGLAWVGCVLLLAACTRDNGAFDGTGGGGTASTGGDAGTTRTDGVDAVDVDGPQPGTGSASGTGSTSGVDGNDTVDDAPPLTTGRESTTEEATTRDPPEGTTTTTGTVEEGSMTGVMEGGPTTGPFDDAITCCMGESCNNPDIADDCVCNTAVECCEPGPWNLYCTAVAVQNCGLMCVPPPGADECCMPTKDFPGCESFEVMACVCSNAGNSACCTDAWTEACVTYADVNCDLVCA